MAKRKQIDWEAIEKEYRLGQKSTRTLANEHNISHTVINRKAKAQGWVQDKSKEIREKTNAALTSFHDNVSSNVSTPTREDIEVAVQTNVQVIREHRGAIKKGRDLVDLLSTQLDEAAKNREEIEDAIFDETKSSDDGKPDLRRRNRMLKAVSLPAHAGTLRDLSTALKNLISLEREAFNLNEPGATLEDVLAALPEQFREVVRAELTKSIS